MRARAELRAQVFLIGDGSHWAYQGASDGVSQKGFPPLAELMDTFIELGGEVSICSSCDGVCSLPGADGQGPARRREIQPKGVLTVRANLSEPVRLDERSLLIGVVVFLACTAIWTVAFLRSFRVSKPR
jgi:hypothetical protein